MADIDVKKGLSAIWIYLSDAQREEMVEAAIVQDYKKGEYIYHAGEESVYLVCMLKGRAKLEKLGIGGRSQIMRMFRPGDIFGYRSYFAAQEHITEAVAVESSVVALVPMSLVERICASNSAFAMYFIRNLAVDLGESDQRTVNLTQKHIRGRLADSIILLIEKYGYEADGSTLNAALSREDLASLSNMTTSNAIRTLSCFASEGIVSVEGRKIKVLNREKLKRINANG